jgi:hypothetical protein
MVVTTTKLDNKWKGICLKNIYSSDLKMWIFMVRGEGYGV